MINPVTNGAMRPGSVDTATKVPRIAPRCAAGATVAMMDDKIGMVTPISASVKKMTQPSVEGTLTERYRHRALTMSKALTVYT
jgi:hypothetical protein